eukprot:1136589-Pelagomonas_calceolata.AAC.1
MGVFFAHWAPAVGSTDPLPAFWLGHSDILAWVRAASSKASQVWGTGYMQAGKEFSTALQILHMNFFKAPFLKGAKQIT